MASQKPHHSAKMSAHGTLGRREMSELSPKTDPKQTLSRHRRTAECDPGCVKTHTSAKCRKHNSPARHRTSHVQYDLTPRDAIARRYFYVWRDRWSFRTAKTHSRHSLFFAPKLLDLGGNSKL